MNEVNLQINGDISTITHYVLFDLTGKVVLSGSNNNIITTLDVKNLDRGQYILSVVANGVRTVEKITLQ